MNEANPQVRVGGSFAPPLTPEKLAAYKALGESCPDLQIRDIFAKLVRMVEVFRETPESTLPGTPHPSGMGTIVPLTEEEIQRIWDTTPWGEELDAYGVICDRLDPVSDKARRDAAFHLIWFGRELDLDREPITTDKLG